MLSIDFHSTHDEEQLSSFTQRLTPWQTWLTQSVWVTDNRMLCSLPRSCLVHRVDRFVSEGWFSSDQVIYLTMFCVFGYKKHAAFNWKNAISKFPVSPGSAEALVRWGNSFATNCCNRTVYVKIIAIQRWDAFLRHSVHKTSLTECSRWNWRSVEMVYHRPQPFLLRNQQCQCTEVNSEYWRQPGKTSDWRHLFLIR